MSLFFKGLITASVGFGLWAVVNLLEGSRRAAIDPEPGMLELALLGLVLMVAGPIIFWGIAPLVRLARRRRKA
jgi:hypothetical protein